MTEKREPEECGTKRSEGGMGPEDLERMSRVLRHRLRNVAAGIRNAVQLLEKESDGKLRPDMMEYFPLLTRECNSVLELTDRLMLLFDSRNVSALMQASGDGEAAAGGVVGGGSAKTVSAFVDMLLEDVHAEFPKREVSSRIDPSVSGLTMPFEDRLLPAFREILRNAAQSTGCRSIIVACRAHGKFIKYQVIDNGEGLDPSEYESIFQPFFTKRSRHIGIGLNIAEKLITEAGGTIKVSAGDGCGLVVDIVLPGL